MDKDFKEEILNEVEKHLEQIKHGRIEIELCESSGHIDIKSLKSKRFYKKKKNKEYDERNKFHKG